MVRILVAEDNKVNRRLIVCQLQALGYEAHAVTNGAEALEELNRNLYDILLIDGQMPQLNGYETAKEIRRRETSGQRQIIIAMTANAGKGDRDICLAAGMDDYLAKPIKKEDLAAALTRWIAVVEGKAAPSPTRLSDDPDCQEALQELKSIAANDTAFLTSLMDTFLEDGPATVQEMSDAHTAANYERMAYLAHRFKSGCATFGAGKLCKICEALSDSGKGGAAEAKTSAELLAQLRVELAAFLRRLESEREALVGSA